MHLTTIVSGQRQDAQSSPALASSPESTPASKKIRDSARQFEAQLLTSVLASLETSFGSVPGREESGASEQYRSLATQSLASAWAAAGGIGIARILTGALSKAGPAAVLPAPSRLPADLWHPTQAFH
jgi:Rod binding domain-containing protein